MTLSWQKRCRSAAGSQRAATRSRTNLSRCNQRPRRMLFTLRSTVLFSSSITASPCVADWWHLRLADECAEPVVTPACGSSAVGAERRRCHIPIAPGACQAEIANLSDSRCAFPDQKSRLKLRCGLQDSEDL